MPKPNPHQSRKLNPATVKRLLAYLLNYKKILAIVTISILISVGANLASSLFLRSLIDDYIEPLLLQSVPIFSDLLKALTILSLIYLIGIFASWLYGFLMVTVAQGVLKSIRNQMFAKMQSLPIHYFDTNTHGDIMSHYTNDIDTLEQFISQGLPQIISMTCTIVGVFLSMLYQSVYLTIVVVVLLMIILQVVEFVASHSGFYFGQQQKLLGELNGYVEEMINGQKVIKVFCHEQANQKTFQQKNQAWEQASANANGYANTMMPLMNSVSYIQYVIIALIGAWMAIVGLQNLTIVGFNTLTLGALASFLTLSRNFIQPIAQLANQFNFIAMALAGAERIFQLIDQPAEIDDGSVTLVNVKKQAGQLIETEKHTEHWAWKVPKAADDFAYIELCGKITFDNVNFGYKTNKLVLKNITLYAEPGQKVAFVGATGAGKTTIANLINRFYDINNGQIQYDGINISAIRKADLRRSLGIVLQDVNLFTGTVMENIRYGNPNASDKDCIAAAKLANAHDFIMMLPKGYDTVLKGDGNGLSQGQRQLLSIARAAVADPPAMILDEATSSIDTRTEALVQNGMDKLMASRTVFVIAHRLSTVMNSDVIMVLDRGKIIERDTHESLLAKRGTYYQLYTGAFELE